MTAKLLAWITEKRYFWGLEERGVGTEAWRSVQLEMAVAVQKMVRPRSAGVAFTLDPTNGDRSGICIDLDFRDVTAIGKGRAELAFGREGKRLRARELG